MTNPYNGFEGDDNNRQSGTPGQPGGLPPYNGDGNGQYGFPAEPNSYGQYGAQELTVPASGGVNIGEAIRWGFSATFSNWKLWILGALAFIIISALASLPSATLESGTAEFTVGDATSLVVNLVLIVASLVITPIIMRLSIHQIDDPTTSYGHWNKDLYLGRTIAVSLVLGLIMFVGIGLCIVASVMTLGMSLNSDTLADPDNTGAITAILGLILLGLGAFMIISLLIYPFYVMIQWLPAEGRATFGQAFTQGLSLGKANYGKLLLFCLAIGAIEVFGILMTCGIGAIVVMPATYLATSHVYRQVVGGQIPAPGR